MLTWKKAKTGNTLHGFPCFEAEAKGGKYRIAPWRHVDGPVYYEAFFIPAGAKSMADVRDIAGSAEQGGEGLSTIEEARAAAEADHVAA